MARVLFDSYFDVNESDFEYKRLNIYRQFKQTDHHVQ